MLNARCKGHMGCTVSDNVMTTVQSVLQDFNHREQSCVYSTYT